VFYETLTGMSVRVGVGGYFRKVGGQRTFRRGGRAPGESTGGHTSGALLKIWKSRCSEMRFQHYLNLEKIFFRINCFKNLRIGREI
jgi:hypothetical protein